MSVDSFYKLIDGSRILFLPFLTKIT